MRASTVAGLALPGLVAIASCARSVREDHVTEASSVRVETGVLPASWYAGGADCVGRPDFQVHRYNADFYILRQAACKNFEKPFLYLLFGSDRALLLDTGAGKVDVAGAVDRIVAAWLTEHRRSSIDLIVAHSHGHGDHVAGDSQFVRRPGVTLVGRDTASVRTFFGIQHWPDDMATYDLGHRLIDVIPIPGHQAASIALYDRRTAILLTGDTFYPGRLYVRDSAAFVRSIHRLVEFSRDKPVTHLLGTHIENARTPFQDYPVGTVDQPDEHVLELSRTQLLELDDTLQRMRGNVVRTVMRDFTVWPVSP
jgi:hydroxyacylglutathione hydrolase